MGVIIKPKRGRPPKYTRALVEEICITIMQSNKGTKRLCIENPNWPCQDTLFTWIKNDYEFSEQYKVVKMIQFEMLTEQMFRIVDDASLITMAAIRRARLQVGIRMWIAGKLLIRSR